MKTCSRCKISKENNGFHKCSRNKDNLQSWCKLCAQDPNVKADRLKYRNRPEVKQKRSLYIRSWQLKREYNLTLDQYNQMLEQQNYSCLICEREQSIFDKKLSVDHDHKTGKIRGLLCSNCNAMLGHINDDIQKMKRAIKYLEERS